MNLDSADLELNVGKTSNMKKRPFVNSLNFTRKLPSSVKLFRISLNGFVIRILIQMVPVLKPYYCTYVIHFSDLLHFLLMYFLRVFLRHERS